MYYALDFKRLLHFKEEVADEEVDGWHYCLDGCAFFDASSKLVRSCPVDNIIKET
jgi:hypothetical protein